MAHLRLEQRPELRQILTPKLIETLKLLILPKLELEARLQQEILENPMLDAVQEEPEASTSADMELLQWRRLLDGLRLSSVQLSDGEEDMDGTDPITFAKYQKTLYEDLYEQLVAASPDERIREIGDFIIGNLDGNGFLPLSVPQIAEMLSSEGKIMPAPEIDEIEKALKLVQSLSPAGIAARDIKECFLLQLDDLGERDSLAYKLVRDHYDDLISKNIPQLAAILDASVEEIEHALTLLSHLSMSPAEGRGSVAETVEPDVAVYKDEDGNWQVLYNDQDIPQLSINRHYYDLLKQSDELDGEAKKFLLEKLESARWWIDALQQRKQTIVKTMKAIIIHQIQFFEKGPENINPLKMETIADEVGVHPATISRVTRDKYVLTPYGIFSMRKFFVGGLASDDSGEIATERVKIRIKEIIEAENKKKPFSDAELADILAKEGIRIARRTVAKYREQMGIISARMRKRS